MFPFLTVFIIFLLVVYFYRSYNTHKREKIVAAFWEREEQAKHAPAKDLSKVEYVKVPLEAFPIGECDSDEVMLIEEELLRISAKPLLNLNGMTNTDVKIEYGTANFDAVCEMGEDFDRLVVLLCDYAKGLMENDLTQKACVVLEYGRDIDSDVSENYTLLGECYLDNGMHSEFDELVSFVGESDLMRKEMILERLNDLKSA